jgi:hypothetical protein
MAPVKSISIKQLIARATRCGILGAVALLPLQYSHALAQSPAMPAITDTAVQTLFLYNFAKFVDWPERVFASRQSPITLCVYGEKPGDIRQTIGAIDGRLAQGREVRVRKSVTLSELNSCQIVFVPDNERRWLSEVLRIAHGAGALTVSDMDDFVGAGGGIGLLTIDRQIRFECNLEATQAAGLKLSAQLLKLARSVKGQGERN